MRRSSLPYLPALDGLRAVAVLAVLVFHADDRWLPGGHLGVTMFFTLSGFLITALLLVEHAGTGRIDLGAFWARRARRLVPAMFVCFALVAAVAATASSPPDGLVGDAVAASTWLANWRFVLDERTYADLFAMPSPFQHFWSLAIEEQFYLVFPIVFAGLLRAGRRPAAVLLLAAAGASTVAAAALHDPDGPVARAYYGTDARIAEPLVGALLALVLVRDTGIAVLRRGAARAGLHACAVAAAVGLGLGVALTTLGDHDEALYQGGFLAVALATAVVIASLVHPGSPGARPLASRPMVALGRVSYGVYLFHWPVYLLLTEQATGLAPAPLLAVRAAVTVALAALSYRLVEAPIRFGNLPRRAALVGWADAAVAGLAVVTVASGQLAPQATAPAEAAASSGASQTTTPGPVGAPVGNRATAARPAPASAPGEQAAGPTTTLGPVELPRGTPGDPVPRALLEDPNRAKVPDPPDAPPGALRVAVVGDSVGRNLGWGLHVWGDERGDVAVYNLAIAACPLSRGGQRRFPDGDPMPIAEACRWWDDATSERRRALEAFDPDVVVVQDGINEMLDRKVRSWDEYRRPGDPVFDSWLRHEYRTAFDRWRAEGAQIVVTNAVCADWDRWKSFARMQDADVRITALNVNVYGPLVDVTVADLFNRVCPGGQYQDDVEGVEDGRPDGLHFSDEAAAALARNWLGPIVLDAADRELPLG